MARYDFNVIVIGAGSAGLVSAYIAAATKAKVALVEKHRMGGDCLNTGCVPSKALIKAAKTAYTLKTAKNLGIHANDVQVNFAEVMQHVHNSINTIEPHDSVERYTGLGVNCFTGNAEILSPHTVSVNGKVISARSIIVATGATPAMPDIPGLDEVNPLTSDTLWQLKELPQRLLVLGGGPIGVELAQAFSRLGSTVTIVDRNSRLLKREDAEVGELIAKRFADEGIQVLTGYQPECFYAHQQGKFVRIRNEHGTRDLGFDAVLVALGRTANTSGFGLEKLGIQLDSSKRIHADPFLQTTIPGIYVCGDVTGPYQFTHVAAHQAWYASVNALFRPFKQFRVDYQVIPWATFCDPEVARVGLNETEAQEHGIACEVTRYELADLDRAIADAATCGFVKVLTPPGKDKILGVTIVGEHASEMIAEFILAMRHNLGLGKILGTIHIYPTFAEANKFAAGNWRKNHLPHAALQLLEKFHTWRR